MRFYIQTLNPVMLGYAPQYGAPATPPTEAMTGSFGQGVLDWLIPAAQAAEPSKTPPSSVVFVQPAYVPPYAQPQANGDPLLAPTPEFDLADPYLVEKANELGKDPQRIFAFVRDEIGFESYVGSLRGARGTLWSKAGNALDQASLLIALLRISGIPARYAQGTLAKDKAQELIASMFLPAPYRVVGFVPDDAEKSDPVNDPALIAEASQHFWVEFQQGGAFKSADPAFRTAELGQTFTAASGQFAEVPDNLRHQVTVRLTAEITSFSFFGLTDTQTVLNQTFSSAELVGKPLSVGHFVNTQLSGGLLGGNRAHVYSPYVLIGQTDGDISDDPIVRGTDYQELWSTLFPLANSGLTGVFLAVDLREPGGAVKTFEQPLVDRIGYVGRNIGLASSLNLDPQTINFNFDQPAMSTTDVTTLNIESSWYDSTLNNNLINNAERLKPEIENLSNQLKNADPSKLTPEQQALFKQLNVLTIQYQMLLTQAVNAGFSEQSKISNQQLGAILLVKAYFASPRITTVAIRSPQKEGDGLKLMMDLTHNMVRAIVFPKQSIDARSGFHTTRGLSEAAAEDTVMASIFQPDSLLENAYIQQSSVIRIFEEAKNQGIDLVIISNNNSVL